MLGERIKKAREKICMSQETLAESIGMHTNTIARWERNEVIPRGNSLKKLSQALQVSTAYLLEDKLTETTEDVFEGKSITPSAVKKERAKTKETASESVSPLFLSYTGKDGEKLEMPDTPKNRELFQMLVMKMITSTATAN